MKDHMALEIERHTLLCSIDRCRQIVGLKREVERLKNQLAAVDRQLAVVYDSSGANSLPSGLVGANMFPMKSGRQVEVHRHLPERGAAVRSPALQAMGIRASHGPASAAGSVTGD